MSDEALQQAPWFRAADTPAADPYWIDDDGRLRFRAHKGQQAALNSTARFILVLAGLQSGKTLTGPWWIMREMAMRGPGDYLAAGPTFPLLDLKCLPEYEALFVRRLGFGKLYRGYPPVLDLNEKGRRALFGGAKDNETRILFGAGIKPESLESATVKAAHLDEAGQRRFVRASHEAVLGRLAVHRGRILYTTTPYSLGWLKSEVHDRAVSDRTRAPGDREYEIVQFASTMNPAFPQAEFDEMKSKMPRWKFSMRYEGIFERPAGLIFDSFDEDDVVTPFSIPDHWKRYVGVDFGAVNTASLFYAVDPNTGLAYAYAEYWPQEKKSTAQHAKNMRKQIPKDTPFEARGGAPSEDQARIDFTAAGFPIAQPLVADVEQGIDRVWAAFEAHKVRVFSSLRYYLDETRSYSRKLDEATDEATDEIEDKETFHLSDCARYIMPSLFRAGGGWGKAKRFDGPETRRR